MFESDADRLAIVRAVGEPFSTSRPEKLWLIFDREFIEQTLGNLRNETGKPVALGRTSDMALHELVKESPITRDSDGMKYFVKRIEPDGTGMTLLLLSA
jgi:hypothetical protein